MKDLEALVFDSLVTESGNVFSDKFKITLVNVHGVGEVILFHILFGVADELTNSLNAGRTLMVLELDVLIKDLDELIGAADTHSLEDADKAHLESLKVPVLVDDSVNDMRSENLLGFTSKKEAEVVHHVDGIVAVLLLVEVVRKQLLSEEVDSRHQLLSKLGVLFAVEHTEFYLVHDRAYHGHNKGHIKFLTHICLLI